MTKDDVRVGYTAPDAFTLMIRVLDMPDRSQALILRSLERLRREALCGLWRMKLASVPADTAAMTINPYQEYQQQVRIAPGSLLLGVWMTLLVAVAFNDVTVQIYDTGAAPESRLFSVPVVSRAVVGNAVGPRFVPILLPAAQDMELHGPLNVSLTNQSALAVVAYLVLHIVEPAGSEVAS